MAVCCYTLILPARGCGLWLRNLADAVSTRRTILQDFIGTSLQCVFISVEKDKVRVVPELLSRSKNKVLFMAKVEAQKLNPAQSFEDQVLYGELSSAYLQQLLVITQDVFFPILGAHLLCNVGVERA